MYHPRLKGKHYDMGYQYGSLMHNKGVNFNEIISLSSDELIFGKESLDICETYMPDLCEEIRGLAEGLEINYEYFASWLMTVYGFNNLHGCSCVAVKYSDGILFGRNSDMFKELKKTSQSIFVNPTGFNKFIGHSTGLVLMEDGMNEHGLCVGMNFLVTKYRKPGINTGMLVRYLLEKCTNVNEAIETIKSLPISSTQNIMLADANHNIAVVESSPCKIEVRTSETFLVSTNHFTTEQMQHEHANPTTNWYHSVDRYNSLTQFLTLNTIGSNVEIQRLLSGEFGFTCQYEKKDSFDTLWSVVYDVDQRKLFRSEGNPSRTKFKEDLRTGLLNKRSKD